MVHAHSQGQRFQGVAVSSRQRLASAPAWTGEPDIADLLGDPIAQALMIADRVKREDVDTLMAAAASVRWQ